MPQETIAEPAAARFALPAQILHWAMAALILVMLGLGAWLVGSLGDYPAVLAWHKAVGFAVLVLAVLRVGNRIWHKPPPAPGSVVGPERVAMALSEAAMYALFLAQPIAGWALVSASGIPVEFAGARLPAIAPTDIHLYGLLRVTHSALAYALLVCVVAHVGAVLVHTVGLRDRLLSRMLPARRKVSSDTRFLGTG
ncbi:cytochrome B561 [Segniliparus rotundus DSM 44985]|uniref:Cytochrome B561 n=1 Tax=Segniliparus rotundus (strain ATCC BAA-972 / CDC 1076 / CIP 108378 / DSM 44985 / JCM 13578) TaxID=640132 RepID=D6ZBP3_SEGRD|nr:cytochrome b [Segniliparus rotundus]ADG98995.1 cytochrome B561 [Segniliparus rotundus DSM 44985]